MEGPVPLQLLFGPEWVASQRMRQKSISVAEEFWIDSVAGKRDISVVIAQQKEAEQEKIIFSGKCFALFFSRTAFETFLTT